MALPLPPLAPFEPAIVYMLQTTISTTQLFYFIIVLIGTFYIRIFIIILVIWYFSFNLNFKFILRPNFPFYARAHFPYQISGYGPFLMMAQATCYSSMPMLHYRNSFKNSYLEDACPVRFPWFLIKFYIIETSSRSDPIVSILALQL